MNGTTETSSVAAAAAGADGPCGLSSLIPIGMSCRGRAEAFARRLQSRLRTLGTQGSVTTPENEEQSSENSWLTQAEQQVTSLQPLRHLSHEADSFFDFDIEPESPGSPAEECEYSRLIETASATPHDVAPESGYVCASPISPEGSVESQSSSDGPYFDPESSDAEQRSLTVDYFDCVEAKKESAAAAAAAAAAATTTLTNTTVTTSVSQTVMNMPNGHIHLDGGDSCSESLPPSQSTTNSSSTCTGLSSTSNSTLQDEVASVEITHEDYSTTTDEPQEHNLNHIDTKNITEECTSEQHHKKEDKDEIEEAQYDETDHKHEEILHNNEEVHHNKQQHVDDVCNDLKQQHQQSHQDNEAGDETHHKINRSEEDVEHEKPLLIGNGHVKMFSSSSSSCNTDDVKVSPLEVTTNGDAESLQPTSSECEDASISEEIERRTTLTSPTVISATPESSPGPESKEEKLQASNEEATTRKEQLSTMSTDEEEVEERPQRVRRSSSLKTGKTPPGTPGRKKIVRFADVLGLDLADVRTFMDEVPKIPKCAFDDLDTVEPVDLTLSLGPRADKMLMPLFQQPGGLPNFLDIVNQKQVSLENAAVTDPITLTISGSVRVRNLDFHKSVHVRYTLDNWRSFSDLQANYVENSCDGFSDKFTFIVFGNSLQVGQRIEMAMRFSCKGFQYWDNNYGANYCFQCLPVTVQPRQVQSAPVVSNEVDQWCGNFY